MVRHHCYAVITISTGYSPYWEYGDIAFDNLEYSPNDHSCQGAILGDLTFGRWIGIVEVKMGGFSSQLVD